jgi:hypothetical protein
MVRVPSILKQQIEDNQQLYDNSFYEGLNGDIGPPGIKVDLGEMKNDDLIEKYCLFSRVKKVIISKV